MKQEATINSISDKQRIKYAGPYFGVSESFLRHALMDKKINGYKLGGAVFVSLKEIEKLIEENKIHD